MAAKPLTFDELLEALSGQRELPPSRTLAYSLPLSTEQVSALVPLLQDSDELVGLKLRGCRLEDEHCEALSRSISFNTSLRYLDLRDNSIGDLGKLGRRRRQLPAAARRRRSLDAVAFPVLPAGARLLTNALRSFNETLVSLDLTGEASTLVLRRSFRTLAALCWCAACRPSPPPTLLTHPPSRPSAPSPYSCHPGNPVMMECPETVQEIAAFTARNEQSRSRGGTPPTTSPRNTTLVGARRPPSKQTPSLLLNLPPPSAPQRDCTQSATPSSGCPPAPPYPTQACIQEVPPDTPAGRTRITVADAQLEQRCVWNKPLTAADVRLDSQVLQVVDAL